MALNPVETLNVFNKDLRTELRSRSFSKNLVRIRTPFLRFTTATDMSNIDNAGSLGPTFGAYKDCRFFTLGLHGWDNKNYSAADLYGTQSDKGLVIGTTYKQSDTGGEQRLMYTHTATSFRNVSLDTAAQNFPPPGITSATVERLRNGNVLKFTLEIQCYTQEQLEVLDAVCFIPGMTSILEWGTIHSTTDIVEELTTLDFKRTGVETDIRLAIADSRLSFIDKWCKPNKFNYDFAVANIANVKTSLQNDVYKITVVAYGRADNLLYISAYSTSNPLDPNQVNADQAVVKSVSEYFRINGPFSTYLKDNVNNTAGNIIRFYDPIDRASRPGTDVPSSADSGTTNDLGLEDSYFISFGHFVDEILNRQVVSIINSATNGEAQLSNLVSPLIEGTDVIVVGFNEYLRSTNPETMIIFNEAAIAKANKRTTNEAQQSGLINQLQRSDGGGAWSYNNRTLVGDTSLLGAGGAAGNAEREGTYNALQSRKFGSNVITESGITALATGVWLNSKGIQSVFLNARTIMEGLEALLRNINAATENYWDLKLFYDDDKQQFRILDDNARTIAINSEDKIYEFNKKLLSTNVVNDKGQPDILGPDVLDIQVSTDYPKMLFSQLAVSGINGGNLITAPERRDADFVNNKGLTDIFARTNKPQSGVGTTTPPSYPPGGLSTTDIAKTLSGQLLGDTSGTENISGLLAPFGVAGANGIPPQVVQFITSIFNVRDFLTVQQARAYRSTFERFRRDSLITEAQAAAITALFAYRTKALIEREKNREKVEWGSSFSVWNRDYANARIAARARIIVENKIEESKQYFRNKIDTITKTQQEAVAAAQRQIDAQKPQPEIVGVPGRTGPGAIAARGGL